MSSRLRVPVDGLERGAVELPDDAARYVTRVHRLRAGDELELFDPSQAVQAVGVIRSSDAHRVLVDVSGPLETAPTHNMPVILIQAVGKGDKPEQAVRDATALGAVQVRFVHTQRGVARSSSEHKLERLTRVAGQVARQCGRGDLPQIAAPELLVTAVGDLRPSCQRLLCGWGPGAVPLLEAAAELDWDREVALLIGPEGGLTDTETEQALATGFRLVDLGPYVLRTEAACSVALGTLRASHLRRG